jgi:hypothetical protein
MRNVCKILVVKPEGKIPLGRSRNNWEDDIMCKIGTVVECSAIFDIRITYAGSKNIVLGNYWYNNHFVLRHFQSVIVNIRQW